MADTDDTYRPLTATQAQLERVWTFLMGPDGFSTASLWVLVIRGDDRPFPHLLEMAEIPSVPAEDDAEVVASLIAEVSAGRRGFEPWSEGDRLAFLLSRPGPSTVTEPDRRWARLLYAACREAGLTCAIAHLAADDGVRPLPLDEVQTAI